MTSPLTKTYLRRKEVAEILDIKYHSVPRVLKKHGVSRSKKYFIEDILRVKKEMI